MSDTYTIIKRNIKTFDKVRYCYVEYDCIYTHKFEEFEYYKNTELNKSQYI